MNEKARNHFLSQNLLIFISYQSGDLGSSLYINTWCLGFRGLIDGLFILLFFQESKEFPLDLGVPPLKCSYDVHLIGSSLG